MTKLDRLTIIAHHAEILRTEEQDDDSPGGDRARLDRILDEIHELRAKLGTYTELLYASVRAAEKYPQHFTD